MRRNWICLLALVALIGVAAPAAADGGADCASAPTVNIPADLPFTDSGTTCGKGNTYDDACSSNYGAGEDAIYALNVTTAGSYEIALTGTGTYTGFFVSDGCPDAAPACTGSAVSGSGSNPLGTITFPSTGTYYLHIDTWPTPDCTDFTIDIQVPLPDFYTTDDACATAFEDISATGTALGLTDDGEANIQMPFDFGFFGTMYTAPLDLRVGNNGGILLNATAGDIAGGNASVPSGTTMAIFPFWDDIDDETGDVYWEVLGTAPNRRLVVQWNARPHYNNIGDMTFQAVLYETTGEITYVYSDVDCGDPLYSSGASATIGLQDMTTAMRGQAYSFDTASLTTVTCINLTPETVPVELMSLSVE
jgi:hypothetical protein